MSCFNFEYMLVGQVLLDEAACCSPGFRPLHPKSPTPSSYSSFLSPYNLLCDNLGLSTPSPRTMERTLYPIYEADEEGKDYEDDDSDDDEDYGGAFDAPFLRFFKSCLVQFAYMMPADKALKSPPPSPRKG